MKCFAAIITHLWSPWALFSYIGLLPMNDLLPSIAKMCTLVALNVSTSLMLSIFWKLFQPKNAGVQCKHVDIIFFHKYFPMLLSFHFSNNYCALSSFSLVHYHHEHITRFFPLLHVIILLFRLTYSVQMNNVIRMSCMTDLRPLEHTFLF